MDEPPDRGDNRAVGTWGQGLPLPHWNEYPPWGAYQVHEEASPHSGEF